MPDGDGRCPDCEYTPSGHFAYPCQRHGCAGCGHLRHVGDECGHPDPHTGWCECETDGAPDAPDLSCSPDEYADHADYAHAMATLAARDTDKGEWAIGGEDPDSSRTEIEYAIEPQRGGSARCHDDELAGLIDELVDYAAGARLIVREITYGPWRYVTPEEITRA